MKIEILYPELCNLSGDLANVTYLEKCLPNAKFYKTNILNEPQFLSTKIDMIYIGTMSEESQKLVIDALRPYKKEIQKMIDSNVLFLVTGNALEIFGNYIEEDTKKIKGLEIFNIYSKREMLNRHNSLFLGTFNNIEMVGFKSHFAQTYGDVESNSFINVTRGYGMNLDSKYEGIKKNNFFATYLIGPLLILNPLFTKYLLSILNVDGELPFEKESMEAYEDRLIEFKDASKKFIL